MRALRPLATALLPLLLLGGCAAPEPAGGAGGGETGPAATGPAATGPASGSFLSELEAAAADAAGGSFALADLDSVPGGSFLVVCPYETPEAVAGRLAAPWPDAPDLSQRDDRQAVVVVDAGRVVAQAELPRDALDLCAGADAPWPLLPVTTTLEVSPAPAPLVVSR